MFQGHGHCSCGSKQCCDIPTLSAVALPLIITNISSSLHTMPSSQHKMTFPPQYQWSITPDNFPPVYQCRHFTPPANFFDCNNDNNDDANDHDETSHWNPYGPHAYSWGLILFLLIISLTIGHFLY